MTRIPLVDLHRQHDALRAEIDAALREVLDRGDFVRGRACEEFEAAFADYTGARHALGVGNGTDALVLAMEALGVGPGHEVITAANTFAATAEAILMLCATPVFVDAEEGSLCLDPDAFEAAITPATTAVIPIHLHGHPADMDRICAVAAGHDIAVIEDAAQAQGCRINGRHAGTVGHAGCFSFYPSKNLGAMGDAGMVTTNDDRVAEYVRVARNHGRSPTGTHDMVGRCSRLDSMQAAVLGAKLPHLEGWNDRRRELAARYDRALDGCAQIVRPILDPGSVFHHYAILTQRRDELGAHLDRAGISTGAHYALSLPQEHAYARFAAIPTPVADRTSAEAISLPIFPEMTDDEVDRVVAAVLDFFYTAVG